MQRRETLSTFYTLHAQDEAKAGAFNIYRREDFACHSLLPPNRRNFYKISLVLAGQGVLSMADKTIHIEGNALLFTNPLIPYAWEPLSQQQTGYFCLFTEDFVRPQLKQQSLAQSDLFRPGGKHLFFPGEESRALLSTIFENMMREMQASYAYKLELIRSYLQIVMHEALKLQEPQTYYQPANASQRIAQLFEELLEQQFLIETPSQVIPFTNAGEYAVQLNLHTNTLNRALREATGKTTTQWITERLLKEAKQLLLFSTWDVAEIAYCLGFEHASNFHAFFKKQTHQTPLHFRRQGVSKA